MPISWLYILTAWIKVSSSFSFLANCLMLSMYIKWLIFFCDLVSLYTPVHFLGMWLSGIIVITNSNGDSESPWKIPLGIFTSVKLFPLAVSSNLEFTLVFSINVVISMDILHIFSRSCTVYYSALRYISYSFLLSIHVIARFFISFYCPWRYIDQYIIALIFLWFPCGILYVPLGTVLSEQQFSSLICTVIIFEFTGRHYTGL